jgi:hypothetical protein
MRRELVDHAVDELAFLDEARAAISNRLNGSSAHAYNEPVRDHPRRTQVDATTKPNSRQPIQDPHRHAVIGGAA